MHSNKEDEEDIHYCFIRQPEVSRLTSIPKSSIAIEVEDGNFPAPVEISGRSRGWLKREVYDWMREKLKERDRKEKRKREEKEAKNESNT